MYDSSNSRQPQLIALCAVLYLAAICLLQEREAEPFRSVHNVVVSGKAAAPAACRAAAGPGDAGLHAALRQECPWEQQP